MPPVLRGEMLLDRMGGVQARLSYEQLRKDAQDLEVQIKQLQVKQRNFELSFPEKPPLYVYHRLTIKLEGAGPTY